MGCPGVGSSTRSGLMCIGARRVGVRSCSGTQPLTTMRGPSARCCRAPRGMGRSRRRISIGCVPSRCRRTSASTVKRPDSCGPSRLRGRGTEWNEPTSCTGTRAFRGNHGARCGEPSTRFKGSSPRRTSSQAAICTRCRHSGMRSGRLRKTRFVPAFASFSPRASTVRLGATSGTRGGRPTSCRPPCTWRR